MGDELVTVKREARKNAGEERIDVYVVSQDYGSRRRFRRLKAVRASHETMNICTSEALEVMGPEMKEDRDYNPNGYERFRFRYTPSTCDRPASFENVIRDLYSGATGTSFLWRCKRYPHVMLCCFWSITVVVMFFGSTYSQALRDSFVPFLSTVDFMGPFSIAATVFQIWYESWLQKKDLDAEYYSDEMDKWY